MKFGLRHIRYFIAVAEELHFHRAAKSLGIAQPAVSRAIRNLEEDIGVVLLKRTNRNVQITPAGEVFLEGCQRVVATIDQAIDRANRAHAGKIGSLRIGYTDMAISGNLPDILKSFQDQQPGISVKPYHDTTVIQLQKLDVGLLDAGFVTGPINRAGYEQVPVQSERFVCVTYVGHRLADRESIYLHELANENFVHGTSHEWSHFLAYLIPFCRRAGFVPCIVQEAYNTAGILGLVASGMGVTILTEGASLEANPLLKIVPIEDVTERLQTVAIWKSENLLGPVKLFVDYIRQK